MNFLWVALGGACGASLRYGASLVLQRAASGFPYATLAVNALGCAAAGVALAVFERETAPSQARLFVSVGLLGGFTTFSAFGVETLALQRDGRTAAALANVALNLGLGLAATYAGWRLTAAR
jgi:CrcB protein